ncbi:unnamed protein product [Rhizoctonia solani]|uniref:Uncharacterized protein n=1 Tax=Rhizoctonia solani TaxID=456999 RepID=A0A8H3CKH3_9AGAM|nr:unnamed protein product [Rhizoctonia solani]
MAALNPATVQHTSQESIADVVPPVLLVNTPAGSAEVQLPANLPHGVQTHHPNATIQSHPAVQTVLGPLGAAALGIFPHLGTSPLHRSLYGRRLGN